MLLLLALNPIGCSDYGFGHREDQLATECFDRFFDGETVETDPTCQNTEALGSLLNIIEWMKKDWDIAPGHSHTASQPIALPLNDDNFPDILVITHFEQRSLLRAVSGEDGDPLWSADGLELQPFGGLAGGDIDGDGKVEIIAVTHTNRVLAFEHDGSLKWTSEKAAGSIPETHAYPAIANLDGEGSPEIIVGSAIFDAEGNLLGRGDHGRGGGTKGSTSFAMDLDQDGEQEVIVGNALYNMNASPIWYNGEEDGHPAVADLDRDGTPEIIVSSKGSIRVQSPTDGSVIWTKDLPGNTSGPPVIADFNGDGLPEIGVSSQNLLTVMDGNGDIIWSKATIDPSGYLAASAFDFEGDGLPELFYIDENRAWIFAGSDGQTKTESTEHSSKTEMEYGIIVDVDNDGRAEIVIPSMPADSNNAGPNSGVFSFGAMDNSWRPARGIWNQHAYSITNVNDDGTIPEIPELNWKTFNNFRSGNLTAHTGLVMPDLTAELLELCEFECNSGRIAVWVQIGNEGLADVYDPVSIQLLAETKDGLELLDEVLWADGIPAGEALLSIRLDAEGVEGLSMEDILVRVDGGNTAENGGTYQECHEDNNETWWGAGTCVN